MKRLITTISLLLLISCSSDDDSSCGCETVQAGKPHSEYPASRTFRVKLCTDSFEVDNSFSPPVVTNKNGEQLSVAERRDCTN